MTFEDFLTDNGFSWEDPEDRLHIQNMRVAWNAAVEETKKACAEAIDLFVGSDGFVCVQPDEIKNVIMQAGVK